MQMRTPDLVARMPAVSATFGRRRFYSTIAGLAILTVVVGFAPRFYERALRNTPGPRPFVLVHAAVFSAWMVLFLVQTSLVAAHRTDLHRRLGRVGMALAASMAVLGVMTGIEGARDGWNPGGPFRDALAFLVVSFRDILNFSGFAAAGLYYRRRPEIHRRLMLLATTGGLLWPAITRIQPIQGRLPLMYTVLVAFLLASPVRDLIARRKPHQVDVIGALIVMSTFPLGIAIGNSDAWHYFAAWLIH